MQLGPISSPYYGLPQRPEVVDDVVSSAPENKQGHQAQQSEQVTQPGRIPVQNEADSAQREYYYSRIEPVVGRTAEALKNYTDVEEGVGRAKLEAQFGLDIYA